MDTGDTVQTHPIAIYKEQGFLSGSFDINIFNSFEFYV